MTRWLAALPLIVLVALGALFGLYALNRNPQVQPQALVGKPMPDLTLPDLDNGRPVRLHELTAQGPVLVNFFASWCAPCEIEHPQLVALRNQQVRVVGIAYKDAPQNTQSFLTRLGDPFAQRLVDRDGRAGVEFGVTGVPETYVVGRDGVIIAKHTGPLEEADAQRLVAQMR
ncbi:DsbE family thiol:disulfide interchange protein [Phenylobacterium deserti]|uniref:DsbE family thiol:disulfide interchange protein n=1 Tax=Phenylobacterium deserti TaxID=1914756 RepID=A0A328AT40_9CAUL|nr:DsbE family thiol:disulfide interchange protein [Phenylobacterium deserti]RAK57431.1 DsbE family thiol:disulfide interchange protein [Phenylobacterium deserti]